VWSRQFKRKRLKLRQHLLTLLSLASLFRGPRQSRQKEGMHQNNRLLIRTIRIMSKLNLWHCRNNKGWKGLIKVRKEDKKRVNHWFQYIWIQKNKMKEKKILRKRDKEWIRQSSKENNRKATFKSRKNNEQYDKCLFKSNIIEWKRLYHI